MNPWLLEEIIRRIYDSLRKLYISKKPSLFKPPADGGIPLAKLWGMYSFPRTHISMRNPLSESPPERGIPSAEFWGKDSLGKPCTVINISSGNRFQARESLLGVLRQGFLEKIMYFDNESSVRTSSIWKNPFSAAVRHRFLSGTNTWMRNPLSEPPPERRTPSAELWGKDSLLK